MKQLAPESVAPTQAHSAVPTQVAAEDLHVDFSRSGETEWQAAEAEAIRTYGQYGCFLARGLVRPEDLEPIHRDIRRLIERRGDKQ